MAKEFNRTEPAIKKRLYKLNCQYRPIQRDNKIAWTNEENNKLKELFSQGYSSDQIAKILNKSEFSIIEKIRILKVIPDKEFKRLWTLEEEMYLFNNKNKTNEELAIDLNRTVNAIKRKKERLNINLMLAMTEKQGVNVNV